MTGFRVQMNGGMLAGLILLALGSIVMLSDDGTGEFAGIPLQTIGLGILTLALIVYLCGRVATLLRRNRS